MDLLRIAARIANQGTRPVSAAMESKKPLDYLVLLNDDSGDSHDFCGFGGNPDRSQELTEEVLSAVGDLQGGEFAGMAADGRGRGRWIQFLVTPGQEESLKDEMEKALSAKFPDGWPLGGEWSR